MEWNETQPIYRQILIHQEDKFAKTEALSREYAQQDLRDWQLKYARYLVERFMAGWKLG